MRFILLLAALLSAITEVQAANLQGHPSVIDGDTIELHGTRIRLFGIDAPESRQLCQDAAGHDYRCGQKAAFALADHINSGTVFCDPRDVDRYGRTVAICYLGAEDLNGWMVEEGQAVAYRRYSLDYVSQEQAAQAAHRGLWAGSFTMPWDWRKQH